MYYLALKGKEILKHTEPRRFYTKWNVKHRCTNTIWFHLHEVLGMVTEYQE